MTGQNGFYSSNNNATLFIALKIGHWKMNVLKDNIRLYTIFLLHLHHSMPYPDREMLPESMIQLDNENIINKKYIKK